MYSVVLLSVALLAWFVNIFPPLAGSMKTGALVTRCILGGVISFCLSGALTRALLDLIH